MDSNISKITEPAHLTLVKNNNVIRAREESEAISEKEVADNLAEVDKTKLVTDGVKASTVTQIESLAKEGNKILENVQRNLRFRVDESTQKVIMSLVDKRTGDVVRQIPTEEAMEVIRRMQETESGGSLGIIIQDKI